MKTIRGFFGLVVLIFSALLLIGAVGTAMVLRLPDVRQLETCFTTSMYSVRLCPGGPDYVKLKDISPYMLHAVIVAEDGSFYTHDGFDWHEMQESLQTDLRSGHIRRGGSTLTQQLAKNAFLDKEKSFWRKMKEAYLAYSIEQRYPKNFILEKYLNVVEFGPDIYGVKRAAEHYFHKSPADLNPLESAYLAFLLPNPKVYSKSFAGGKLTPFGHKMITIILKRMKAYGKLAPDAFETAMNKLSGFPWSDLNAGTFSAAPAFNLEAPKNAPDVPEDAVFEEVIDEDQGAEPPAGEATEQSPALAAPAAESAKSPAPENPQPNVEDKNNDDAD